MSFVEFGSSDNSEMCGWDFAGVETQAYLRNEFFC